MATQAIAPIDTSKGLTILARRAMWRAGRQWTAGANDLDADQAAALGQDKLAAIKADPNFTIAAAGTKAVTVATPNGAPIDAHTVIFAKKPMWRAGRQWNAGATPLTAEQATALGADKIAALKADPNFSVTQNDNAAKAQAKAEADAATKPAAPAATAAKS